MTLDDRLIDFDTWCLCGNKECVLSENFAKNKLAILSDLLEMIGEDEDWNVGMIEVSGAEVEERNKLRQELRDKVKEYCK